MKFVVCEHYDAAMETAADIVAALVREKPDCILGLATGSTPVGMYDRLVADYEAGRLDFSRVQSFNLDEYYPISPENDQSYRYFMNTHLFDRINIDKANTRVPDGSTDDPRKECADYEAAIDASAGVDIQILGIGQNGHIGFNEPEEALYAFTHLTDLTPSTITANSRFFERISDVPRQALTMGMASIMKARKILLLVTGASKHAALKTLMSGRITTAVPATLLQLHPDVTVICDRAACDCLYLGVDIGGTEIKFGVVSDHDLLIHQESVPTDTSSEQALLSQVASVCKELMAKFAIQGVGVGSPGAVDTHAGRVDHAANLPFNNTDVQGYLEKELGVPVKIGNDANCAVLGEYYAGSGVGCRNMVMVTLGTGIGGGIVIDGKLYTGSRGDGAEIGHMVTHTGGRPCPCGRVGCFEQYASASALIAATEAAVAAHPDSLLSKLAADKISGKTAFEAMKQGCPVATQVVDAWMDELAAGLQGVQMVFSPDLLVLAGGIANEGEGLLEPLRKKCGGITLSLAKLKNTAGMIGAAMLQYKEFA